MLFRYSLKELCMLLPAVLMALVLHEMAHGWAAYLLGDRTAKEQGRLSLDPLKHLDLIGTVCMLLGGVGWARPVPIDPSRFRIRNQKLGMAITAIAGPLCNFLQAFLAAVIAYLIRWKGSGAFCETAVFFLAMLAALNVGLGTFNLIPVPPLDGSRLLLPLLPDRAVSVLLKYERICGVAFLALIASGALNGPIDTVRGAVMDGILRAAWRTTLFLTGGAA